MQLERESAVAFESSRSDGVHSRQVCMHAAASSRMSLSSGSRILYADFSFRGPSGGSGRGPYGGSGGGAPCGLTMCKGLITVDLSVLVLIEKKQGCFGTGMKSSTASACQSVLKAVHCLSVLSI
ncbi:unnamed protein product [Sphagnum balticum]